MKLNNITLDDLKNLKKDDISKIKQQYIKYLEEQKQANIPLAEFLQRFGVEADNKHLESIIT